MKKVLKNTFAQPISDVARNMYLDLLKRSEKEILKEADPRLTYITDNNMNVVKFIALGGDQEKRHFDEETFRFMGHTLKLPYEEVTYNVVDMATGNVSKEKARYLDTKDTEVVAEVYKEFYRLAEFLVSQEIAMKGLLPTLTEKGEYIVDPKSGIPLVGTGYLEHYFGLSHAASQEERAMRAAVADINRWAHATFLYQIKAEKTIWKAIHNKLRTGDIAKYGVGPSLDNIGTSDFDVNPTALTPESYITGTTSPETHRFDVNGVNGFRSDLPNLVVSQNRDFNNSGFVAPQPVAGFNNIQPSIQQQPVQQGPIVPNVPPKNNSKKK